MRQLRLLLWLVVLALVAAQALGLMHRVVHPQLTGAGVAGLVAHAQGASVPGYLAQQRHQGEDRDGHTAADHDHDHDHGQGWVAALFSAHADDGSCRLFDPLQHEGALTLPALLLPVALTSRFIDFSRGDCLARWAALYDARGPPPLR